MRWAQMRLTNRIAVLLGGAVIVFGLLLLRDCFGPPASHFVLGGASFFLAPASLAIGALLLLLGLTPVQKGNRPHAPDPLAGAVAGGAVLLAVGAAGWLWAVNEQSENGLLGALLAVGAGVPGAILVCAGGAVLVWRRLRRPRDADSEAAQTPPPLHE